MSSAGSGNTIIITMPTNARGSASSLQLSFSLGFGADAAVEKENGLEAKAHEEKAAEAEAQRIAMQGREWAGKVLRNEDLEVWFFRLLLEYGRLIDDNRESIGFSL